MEKKSARKSDSRESEADGADRSSDPTREQEATDSQSDESNSPSNKIRKVGRSGTVRASAVGGTPTGQKERSHSSGGEYVSYDRGSDPETLSARYGMDVRKAQAGKLQRLEQEFGADRVSRWAEEGMPVSTMGKPKDMQAFRKRQETRSEEIPTDIERRNQASRQRNAAGNRESGPAGETGGPDVVRSVVSSPGRSMDETVQREMEAKMGGDFSDVQLHTGPEAAAAAESINSRAFTVGNHVAFNNGEYRPEESEGKRVLAHELTHVRQQTEGTVSMLAKSGFEHPGASEGDRSGPEVTVQHLGTEMHVQPKLKLSSPDDPAEREAERIAQKVLQMDESDVRARATERSQRLSEANPGPSKSVNRSASSGELSGDLESTVRSGVRGSGKPLPKGMRSSFESKMGADFSDVRIHTGSAASQAARTINAEAYTMGSDIAFGKGNYEPRSSSGKELLAHELTHVVQQDGGVSKDDVDRQNFEAQEISADRLQMEAVDSEIDAIKANLEAYCNNWKDNADQAITNLTNHFIFPDNVETDADVIGKLQDKLIKDVAGFGKDKVLSKTPYGGAIETAWGFADTAVKELERAEKAEKGVTKRNFINKLGTNLTNQLSAMQEKISDRPFDTKLRDIIGDRLIEGDADNPVEVAKALRDKADELSAPQVQQIQQKVTEEYVNYMNSTDVLHISGELVIRYEVTDDGVDEGPTFTLKVPSAEAVRDSITQSKEDTTADTATLPIRRKVIIKKTDVEGSTFSNAAVATQRDYALYIYEPGSEGYSEHEGLDLLEHIGELPKMDWNNINTSG